MIRVTFWLQGLPTSLPLSAAWCCIVLPRFGFGAAAETVGALVWDAQVWTLRRTPRMSRPAAAATAEKTLVMVVR